MRPGILATVLVLFSVLPRPLAAGWWSAPRMTLPADFPRDMTLLRGKGVMNRIGKKPLLFPPFQVTQFRFSAVHSHQSESGSFPEGVFKGAGGGLTTLSIGSTEKREQSRQDYSFRLEESGQAAAWEGKCHLEIDSSSRSSGIVLTSGTVNDDLDVDQVALHCELREEGGGDPWRLDLRRTTNPVAGEGTLARDAAVSFQVTPTNEVLDGKVVQLPVPSGFLFSRDGLWLAAAEWWRPGALRLAPTLDSGERRLLATASAAVLLSNSLQTLGF